MALGHFSVRLWRQLCELLDYLDGAWQEPDDGILEARGPWRHYTQSKVMAWLAFDRAIALGRRDSQRIGGARIPRTWPTGAAGPSAGS